MIGLLLRARARLRELHVAGLVRVDLTADGLPPCVLHARRPTTDLLARAWNADPRRYATIPAYVDTDGDLSVRCREPDLFLSVTVTTTTPTLRAVLISHAARVLLFLFPG